MNIGDRIIQLRKQTNLSQAELAKQLNVSRTIMGNYERNTNTPPVETLLNIAKIFNVSVDYLVGEGSLSSYDKDLISRIEDIEQLDDDTKNDTTPEVCVQKKGKK